VKVTDFGIARAASSPLTTTSAVLGTAGYMSPEQAMGEPVGPQSDLYSLGVVLYEMLTGELPYNAESPVALALKHVHEAPRSPREVNPGVPEPLNAVTVRLLAKKPEDRYASASELADDLERVRSGLPPTAVDKEKTAAMAAPLSPLPAAPEGQTAKTAVRQPVAAPVKPPGDGGRRRGRLFSALAALLFGALLLGGVIWALTNFLPGLGGSEDQSGANQSEAPAVEEPSTVIVPDLYYASGAADALASAGLKLGNRSDVPNDAVPVGVVVQTNPLEGTEVEQGTAVDIVVSTGPAQAAPAVQAVPAPPTPAPPAAQKPAKEEKPKKEKKPRGKGKQKGKDD
jgi:hypothetical protein